MKKKDIKKIVISVCIFGLLLFLPYFLNIVEDFHGVVDDYLDLCETQGITPEKAYKGNFNVRISPELHKKAVICAAAQQMSLNSFVERALERSVAVQN